MNNLTFLIAILISIIILIILLKFKNKNLIIIHIFLILVLFIFSSITILRSINPVFRVNYDIRFNNYNEQVIYENGQKYHLPLPKDTAKLYKYSDYGIMYCTKLTYDEFVKYYDENGYNVKNNDIICDDVKYTLNQVDKYMDKYTTIRIETCIY